MCYSSYTWANIRVHTYLWERSTNKSDSASKSLCVGDKPQFLEGYSESCVLLIGDLWV